MKKTSIIVLALVMLFSVNPTWAASPWPNPPGQDKENGNGGNASSDATAIGVGVGIGIAGAAAINNTEVKSTNVIMNSQSSFNSNKNSLTTSQGQGQEQSISAPLTNSVSVVNEKNDRELLGIPGYQAPAPGDYRGPHKPGVFGKMAPWEKKSTWTRSDLKDYPAAGSLTAGLTVKIEAVESFNIVTKPSKTWIGDLLNEGDKGDAPSAVWGKVAKAALDAGCEEIVIVGSSTAFMNAGSGFNLGLGGGFSATNGGADNYGGSVGAGTGWGSFKVGPHEKASMGADCYGNPQNLKKAWYE